MTSYYVEKDMRVMYYDISVIVDNYVEIGDFFLANVFEDEII